LSVPCIFVAFLSGYHLVAGATGRLVEPVVVLSCRGAIKASKN